MSNMNASNSMSSNVNSPKGSVFGCESIAITINGRNVDETSLREVSVIENMTTFLQEHGGADVDPKVLRTIAEALSKRLNDTSPSTLKDVTMEHSYGIGFPCSSLQQSQGTISPSVQGRSVREFEEQMASLRKENFNLKLRLYFLEESVPGYQQASAEGQESLMKQLIDTKVEMEILRKELEEKQEILKEAAQAMNQMEQIQKETENKSQVVIDELKQKIQYLEMERDLDKSHHSGFMSELIGRSEISENVNALQKIRELEGIVKQSEEKMTDMQIQNNRMEDVLVQRDETIKEYEEKVKELAFQNAELLEALENKEKEIGSAERNIKGLRLKNADLKEDNRNLIDALKATQDNFRKEMSNIKTCERQMREQQDALSKMQSTISIKTANTARLLERIQDYEKMVTKINFERNLAKRENRFFRAIIGKLQRNKNEYLTIEKEEVYQQIAADFDEKPVDCNKHYDLNYRELKARGDFHGEYMLKQKLCVNYSNSAKFTASSSINELGKKDRDVRSNGDALVQKCFHDNCEVDSDQEPDTFPIRYTISDASLFAGASTSKTNSCSSLQANFSSSSIFGGSKEPLPDRNHAKRLRKELMEKKLELADKTCMLDDTEQELKIRTQAFDKACRTIHKLMQLVKSHQEEVGRLKNREPITQDSNVLSNNSHSKNGSGCVAGSNLECTDLCRSLSDSEAFIEFSGSMKQKYEAAIEQYEQTINSLRAEVKKKTAALQNLVNKELWEKNREIERLTKLINNSSVMASTTSPLAARKCQETHELQQSFTETEYAKALEHNQLLQRKVDVLNQRLGAEHSNEAVIDELRRDVRNARAEAESADKWRRECADVCSLLSNRLEELAGFLNSLLKHKDVIGLMAPDRRRAMRNAIDCSLDLSKSLNMTLSYSALSIGDQSLSMLHHQSWQQGGGDEDGSPRKSLHLLEHVEERYSFDTLRAENRALKKELDHFNGTELNKKDRHSLPLLAKENQSESEAWSEPDRQVSLARIGLEDRSIVSTKDQQIQPKQGGTDSESDRDALQQSSRTSKLRNQDRIAHLEKMIAQREERILLLQCQLVETDNNLKKESLRAIGLTQEVKHLRQRNEELYTDMVAIGSEEAKENNSTSGDAVPNITLLMQQIKEKTRAEEKLHEELDRIAVEARLAEMQIGALNADIAELKRTHEKQLTLAGEKEQQKLEDLKKEMDLLMKQRLSEKEKMHEEILNRDWVARSLYDDCRAQLVQLQTQYLDAQRNIDYLTESEQELKQSLLDSELALRSLKKQLDESTLQASKVILERTKVCNEKLQAESRMQELEQQLNSVETERNNLRQQVTQFEKIQHQQQQHQLTKRLSGGEASHSGSGYTSEDVPQSLTKKVVLGTATASTSNVKRENNPSPDLGIESDTGRVSSVELSHAQRSLLKVVEMPDVSEGNSSLKQEIGYNNIENDMSLANVKQQQQLQQTTTAITENSCEIMLMPAHDCVKVDQENAELRLKLIRTKRAFEDTYMKLRVANQRKAHIEKEIKNQIIKTHNVLRNVRSNMED